MAKILLEKVSYKRLVLLLSFSDIKTATYIVFVKRHKSTGSYLVAISFSRTFIIDVNTQGVGTYAVFGNISTFRVSYKD